MVARVKKSPKNETVSHPCLEFSDENSHIIAVTGPMAAGKNYICNQLKEEGWAAVDADLLVHDAIEEVKDKILQICKKLTEYQYDIKLGLKVGAYKTEDKEADI